MYQDTSLASASRNRSRIVPNDRIRDLAVFEKLEKQRQMADRATLGKLYMKHYGIRCSQSEIENLSDRQLLIKLEQKLNKKQEKWAAI